MKLLIAFFLIQVFSIISGFNIGLSKLTYLSDPQNTAKRDNRATSTLTGTNSSTCILPPITPDRSYTIIYLNKEAILDAKPGDAVPKYTIIESQCNEGYAVDYPTDALPNELLSVCSNNSWQPPIRNCKRTCKNFSQFSTFNLTCRKHFYGPKIPCTGLLLERAIVIPKCKDKFHPDIRMNYNYATCREDGNWDKPFYECKPDCGQARNHPITLNSNESPEVEVRGGSPWNVAIYSLESSPEKPKFICGGTLISAELVISAAHCFYDEVLQQPKDIKLFHAIVGKVTPDYVKEDYETTEKLKLKNIFYPETTFTGRETNYASDIVILHLSKKVTFSTDVFPACLHWNERDRFKTVEKTMGKLSGFGDVGNGSLSSVLLSTYLPYISYSDCVKKISPEARSFISLDKFCAGFESGTNVLSGDGGSGLLFVDKTSGLYHLRGVVSTKDSSLSHIASVTDITQYISWILNIVDTSEHNIECNCNSDGAVNGSCNLQTGSCECKKFVTGKDCSICKDGFWNLQGDNEDGCEECNCNSYGTINGTCDSRTGSCLCKSFVTGKDCSTCKHGYWNLQGDNADGCKECNCNSNGAVNSSCDSITGSCQCKVFVTGKYCDICKDGYWNLQKDNANGCEECNCNSNGAINASCDSRTGSCQCKAFVTGKDCDKCKDGFWNLQGDNADGCEECNCNSYGTINGTCDSRTGSCLCKSFVTGKDCSTCKHGYWNLQGDNADGCKECNCNSNGAVNSSCDSITGSCQCKVFVTGKYCDICKDGYWNLQKDNANGCEECNCNSNGAINASCDSRTGSCQCKAFVTGKDCDKCKDGFWNLQGDNADGCEECNCNSNGAVNGLCDSRTGSCQCKAFVTGKDCDICKDGYWNLSGDNAGGCEACGCNSVGSDASTCGKFDGSCQCKLHFAGRQCDRCIDDTWVLGTNGCEEGPKWVKFKDGEICSNAVVGGYAAQTKETLYSARLWKDEDLLLGKLVPSQKAAFATRGFEEYRSSEYEILCGGLTDWVATGNGDIPQGAVGGGLQIVNGRPTTLYVCRERNDDGSVIPGKLHLADRLCLIPKDGKVSFRAEYEVLVQYDMTACECNSIGSYNPTCERIDKSCKCKPNVIGKKCDRCAPDTYSLGLGGCKQGPEWLKYSNRGKCSNAILGGYDTTTKELVYIIRHSWKNNLHIGKLLPSHDSVYIPGDEKEQHFNEYEVLCGDSTKWVAASSGGIPPNAVGGGIIYKSAGRETLYVCRVKDKSDSIVPGMLHRYGKVCYYSYAGAQRSSETYEVLQVV